MIEIIAEIKANGFIIENTCDYERMKDAFDCIHDLIDDAIETDENQVRHIQNHNTGTGYASIWNIAGFEFSIIENSYGYGFIILKDEFKMETNIMDAKTVKKCIELGILNDVQSIIKNCECGEITKAEIIDLQKVRKWEIIETIGNYLDNEDFKWVGIKRIRTFCKLMGIHEREIADYYRLAINEDAYYIAYTINKDIILILE